MSRVPLDVYGLLREFVLRPNWLILGAEVSFLDN